MNWETKNSCDVLHWSIALSWWSGTLVSLKYASNDSKEAPINSGFGTGWHGAEEWWETLSTQWDPSRHLRGSVPGDGIRHVGKLPQHCTFPPKWCVSSLGRFTIATETSHFPSSSNSLGSSSLLKVQMVKKKKIKRKIQTNFVSFAFWGAKNRPTVISLTSNFKIS